MADKPLGAINKRPQHPSNPANPLGLPANSGPLSLPLIPLINQRLYPHLPPLSGHEREWIPAGPKRHNIPSIALEPYPDSLNRQLLIHELALSLDDEDSSPSPSPSDDKLDEGAFNPLPNPKRPRSSKLSIPPEFPSPSNKAPIPQSEPPASPASPQPPIDKSKLTPEGIEEFDRIESEDE